MRLNNRLRLPSRLTIKLLLILSAWLPNMALAADQAPAPLPQQQGPCQDVIAAGRAMKAAGDNVINLKTQEITVQKEIIAAQDTHITELENDKNSVFKSPWFYTTLGLVVGGFLVAKVRR